MVPRTISRWLVVTNSGSRFWFFRYRDERWWMSAHNRPNAYSARLSPAAWYPVAVLTGWPPRTGEPMIFEARGRGARRVPGGGRVTSCVHVVEGPESVVLSSTPIPAVRNEDSDSAPTPRFDDASDGDGDGDGRTDASGVEAFEAAWIDAIKSSVWSVASVSEEPAVVITGWFVVRMPTGYCHLAGRNARAHESRVTTAVVSLGPEERQVVTTSGRLYELVGPPGRDLDAMWVVGSWLRAHLLTLQHVGVLAPGQVQEWIAGLKRPVDSK